MSASTAPPFCFEAMCGIIGKVYRDRQHPVDPDLVERMKRCIVHRGPNEDGSHVALAAGLGFQRLAIIDIKTGQQPMFNEDRSKVIVFNGEIYNFPGLRDELIAAGHTFATRSDTETILHGYEQWGTGVLDRLRGMFAFAIYDTCENTLFAARDRVGKKPLYYAHLKPGTADEALIFASELKSLLADPDFERRVDFAAVSHYLTYEYVPHPWSIFEQAKKLPAGHWMLWRNGELATERYWDLPYQPKISISEEDAIEQSFELIDECVRIRLMSEVPLGCFLSGGVDSSMIVAMMRRHITGDLKTFSIGFKEEKFNELPYARQVAQQFATNHQEFIVEPNAFECIGTLAWHYDEPMSDESSIPTYYLSKMTSQYVTVALNGDGGDESFLGYARYRGVQAVEGYKRIPRMLRAMADGPLAGIANATSSSFFERWSYGNQLSLMSDDELYLQGRTIFTPAQKRRLLASKYRPILNEAEADSPALTLALLQAHPEYAEVERMVYSDIMMYLPGALLPKVDRATMAVSLEGRAPLLDYKLMEFAARLPVDLKFRNRELKRLLKKVALRFFSESFLNRPKQGFGMPVGQWIRGDLRKATYDLLLGEPARNRGFFDVKYVQMLLDQHVSGARDYHNKLWNLIVFEAWCRTFLDRSDPLSGPITIH